MRFDDIGVVLPVVIVEMLEQFLLADDLSRMMQQVFENVVLRGRKINQYSSPMNGLLESIELNAECIESGVRCAFAATDQGFGACHQFAEVEGFGEIVVCTGIEKHYGGFFAFLGSEDEHWR